MREMAQYIGIGNIFDIADKNVATLRNRYPSTPRPRWAFANTPYIALFQHKYNEMYRVQR